MLADSFYFNSSIILIAFFYCLKILFIFIVFVVPFRPNKKKYGSVLGKNIYF